jgi:hypothetical protein
MAGVKGNKNAVGNSGGKSLHDREIAAKVRNLALEKIAGLLEMPVVKMSTDDYELYKQVLIRLAGTVLPRLTEVSGEDGKPLIIQIAGETAKKYGINSSTGTDNK